MGEYELRKELKLIGYDNIEINEEESTIKLKLEGSSIDLGGIAKGYITDKIIEFYKLNGIRRGIINLGGNVKVFGNRDEKNLCQIGILEPVKHSSESVCAVLAENLSVVTSGSYERAFIMDGKTYSHIILPNLLVLWHLL